MGWCSDPRNEPSELASAATSQLVRVVGFSFLPLHMLLPSPRRAPAHVGGWLGSWQRARHLLPENILPGPPSASLVVITLLLQDTRALSFITSLSPFCLHPAPGCCVFHGQLCMVFLTLAKQVAVTFEFCREIHQGPGLVLAEANLDSDQMRSART